MWIIVERSQSLGSNARFLEIQEKVEKEAALSSTILAQRQLDRCYTFAAKLRRNAKAQVGWKTPSLCWELNHWDQDAVNVDNLCRSRFLFWNQPQIPPYWSVLTHLCPREDIKHARVSCKKQNINKYFISWGSCWQKNILWVLWMSWTPSNKLPSWGWCFCILHAPFWQGRPLWALDIAGVFLSKLPTFWEMYFFMGKIASKSGSEMLVNHACLGKKTATFFLSSWFE